MRERDHFELLNIGHSNDGEIVKAMHRAGQRVVLFRVEFEDLPPPPESRDYRVCLSRIWKPFLTEAGLAAGIGHQGWYPDSGLVPSVLGHVWRQHGKERLGTVTEQELFRLSDLLRVSEARVTGFRLTELITTKQRGRNLHQRKLCFRHGEFSIEADPTAA